MLGRNIKYYRVKRGLTEGELSSAAGVTKAQLKKYEQGGEIPELSLARRIASILDVKLAELMIVSSYGHKYEHCEYRKHSRFTKHGQEYVRVIAEDYLDRFLAVIDILEGKVLRNPPKIHSLHTSGDIEKDASRLRELFGFSLSGAIPNLLSALEDRGILMVLIDYDDKKFSGMNGLVDERPYVVLNSQMTAERQRSTLVHEIAHIYFARPEDDDDTDLEKYMTAVSGAFLFPKDDAYNELGERRSRVSSDMQIVSREYGISLQMLAKRANVLGIISDEAYKDFNVLMSTTGMRTREPSRIEPERTKLFEQLVLRALSEGNITEQRGAELLRLPYAEVHKRAMLEG